MVTKHIQLALKSAHQTLGHLQENLNIPKTPETSPSGCRGLEEQQGI